MRWRECFNSRNNGAFRETGVHSGDSITIYPTQNLCQSMKEKVLEYTKMLAVAIGIKV